MRGGRKRLDTSTQGEYTKSKAAYENLKDFNVSKRQSQILPLRPKITQALNVLEIRSIIVSHHRDNYRDRNAFAAARVAAAKARHCSGQAGPGGLLSVSDGGQA